MQPTGRFTPALRRLVHASYNECRNCGARLPKETAALAGYDPHGRPAYVGPCCWGILREFASHIYWALHSDRRCAPEQALWRYMDIAKFLSLLEDRAIYFSRADKLGDPFEGAAGIAERQPEWDQYYKEFFRKSVASAPGRTVPATGSELELESSRLLQEFKLSSQRERMRTYAVCWHGNTVESEALWRLYCPPPSPGVVIQTTAAALLESMGPDCEIEIGRVQYLDFRTAYASNYERIYTKRKSLSHESEIRAVLTNHMHPDPPLGHMVNVDLSVLVKAVIPSPFAPPWLHGLVARTLFRHGLSIPVISSELLAEPFF